MEIEATRSFIEEISRLSTELNALKPKAKAFDVMRTALITARAALNIGLQPFYVHGTGKVSCKICLGEWEVKKNPNGTASALIDHDPNATCGIMHSALQCIDEALAKSEAL